LSISPAAVRCVWQRRELTSMKLRLKALEPKVVQDGILLTVAQIAALEKAKADKEAYEQFESERLGYCEAQDSLVQFASPQDPTKRQHNIKNVSKHQ
jgi:hypothetical protein